RSVTADTTSANKNYTLCLHDALPIYNYLVIPKNLLSEIENCDLFKSLLWKGIGILLVNIESAEIEVYRKPKKKTWNLGMQNILRSEEHTSELQSRFDLVCRLLLEKKK